MPDKQCAEHTVHPAHAWCEREYPEEGRETVSTNPLKWFDCTGINAQQVYHRTKIVALFRGAQHTWECSCGERGIPTESEPDASHQADLHTAKFKAAEVYHRTKTYITEFGQSTWECTCGEKGTASGGPLEAANLAALHTEAVKPKLSADVRGGLFSQWRHDYHYLEVIGVDSKDAQIPEARNLCELDEANLVSSRIDDGEHAGKHTVAIDLDVPAVLIPSSTPGHSHLYIDVPMTWEQYNGVLEALAGAGILETGYVAACKRRKHTSLRLPWIRKAPPAPPTQTPF